MKYIDEFDMIDLFPDYFLEAMKIYIRDKRTEDFNLREHTDICLKFVDSIPNEWSPEQDGETENDE